MNSDTLQSVLTTLKQNPNDHSFVTVDTVIDVRAKCNKKNRANGTSFEESFPGHSKVYKVSRRYDQAGLSYFNNVNNKLAKKGLPPMEQGERKWGHRIGDTMLIEHNDKVYIELFASENANVSKHQYIWDDGTRLTKDEVNNLETNFLPIPKPSKKQKAAGLDNGELTIYLNIKLENIVRFSGYGVTIGDTREIV